MAGTFVKVRVHPGSKRESILRHANDRFEVWVREKPERGKANVRVRELLAVALGEPSGTLRLVKGGSRPNKLFALLLSSFILAFVFHAPQASAGLRINTNVASINAQRQLERTTKALNETLERLSAGLRINRAADDSAGLAISERFASQVRSLNQAVRNAHDGISLVQTADAALQENTNTLRRIRELAVQAGNDTNTASDRLAMQWEVDALLAKLERSRRDVATKMSLLLAESTVDVSVTEAAQRISDRVGQVTLSVAELARPAFATRNVQRLLQALDDGPSILQQMWRDTVQTAETLGARVNDAQKNATAFLKDTGKQQKKAKTKKPKQKLKKQKRPTTKSSEGIRAFFFKPGSILRSHSSSSSSSSSSSNAPSSR